MSLLLLAAALSQPAAAQPVCTFTLNPTARSVPASPDTVGNLSVTASASSCVRTAVTSHPDWLTISLGTTGTGNGTVGYRVDSNDTPAERTGTISIGNARFTVTQAARVCNFELSALSARVAYQSGRGNFRVTTDCRWTAVSSAPWLRLASTAAVSGNGAVDYVYDENPSTETRTATITIGARVFTVTQTGMPCTFQVTPTAIDVPAGGASGTIQVTSNCTWTAAASQTWISIAAARDTIAYQVAPNPLPQTRTGAITLAGQTVAIRQAAAVDVPLISGIANAASYVRNFAAPGAILVFKGSRLTGATLLFDGIAAPVFASSDELAWAHVPYEAAGKTTVRVVAELDGKRSAEYTLPLTPTAPGLFTQSGTGAGNAVSQNEDLTVNSPANPAARGSSIFLYATGEGVTERREDDLPHPLAPVQLFIGGVAAPVTFSGGVAGGATGLVQIRATVPQAAAPGDFVPVDLRIGGRLAQDGVTVSIR